jgi:BirA family biotin operon repressor/biotin-[acetyl-CoA-carboxylase] ligase
VDSREALVRLLADGELHTGPQLAAALGCSRSAVWKALQGLEHWGLQLDSLPGRGYQLAAPLDLLDAEQIHAELKPDVGQRIVDLSLHWVTDSTNRRLQSEPAPSGGCARICLAEFQTGGRGRRGRRWFSPLASGLCLSLAWRFDTPPPGIAALGPAVGAMLREALAGPAADARLKWPNDIVTERGKLAGLLLEVDGEADGPLTVVIGIGVNVSDRPSLPPGDKAALPPASLSDSGRVPSRSRLAAQIIDALVRGLRQFQAEGFAPFADHWAIWDAFRDRPVTVTVAGQPPRGGIARGVAADGALLLEAGGRIETLYSGDVSLRAAA